MIRQSLGKGLNKLVEVLAENINDEIGPECPHCHHAGMMLISVTLPDRLLLPFRTS
ncbi:MAG: hypothetical protein QNK36_20605 [Colwellia sp.]|nr:hypothetical protein [Colwellia sp.]